MRDFTVIDQGSLVLVYPRTQEAKDWINENVSAEPYMWNGRMLHIEHRYAGAIISGMLDEGLEEV